MRCVNGEKAGSLRSRRRGLMRSGSAGRRKTSISPPRTANWPARRPARLARTRQRQLLGEGVEPGLSPTASEIGSGRASGGGMPSAIAVADAQTRPPASSTSSARARSPTRCGGGSSPDSQPTPRLGRSATRSSPMYQPAASAASRASVSSGARTRSGRRAARATRRGRAEAPARTRGRERAEPRRRRTGARCWRLEGERVEDGTVHDD